MAKPNRVNTCPKKKQSRRAIDRRMVQENDFMELNRKLTHLLKGRTIQSESGDEGQCADYIRRRIHAKAQGRRPGDNKRGSEG